MSIFKSLLQLVICHNWVSLILLVAVPLLLVVLKILQTRGRVGKPALENVGRFWKNLGILLVFVSLLAYLGDALVSRYTTLGIVMQNTYNAKVVEIVDGTAPGSRAASVNAAVNAKSTTASHAEVSRTVKRSSSLGDFGKAVILFFADFLLWLRGVLPVLIWCIIGGLWISRGSAMEKRGRNFSFTKI